MNEEDVKLRLSVIAEARTSQAICQHVFEKFDEQAKTKYQVYYYKSKLLLLSKLSFLLLLLLSFCLSLLL